MKEIKEITEKLYKKYFIEVEKKFQDLNVKQELENYLSLGHSEFFEENSDDPESVLFILSEIEKDEDDWFGKLNLNLRYEIINPDPELKEIQDASAKIYSIAMDKYNNGSVTEEQIKEAEENFNYILENQNKVREYNIARAKQELSETSVEFRYIKGTFPYYSLRMGRMNRYKTPINNDESNEE